MMVRGNNQRSHNCIVIVKDRHRRSTLLGVGCVEAFSIMSICGQLFLVGQSFPFFPTYVPV